MDPLNIGGSEWIIIIFAALVLILGTSKLPEIARKLGRASYEFNKAKADVENPMGEISGHTVKVREPVESERQKLESIAKSLKIDPTGMSDSVLQKAISDRIGGGPGQQK